MAIGQCQGWNSTAKSHTNNGYLTRFQTNKKCTLNKTVLLTPFDERLLYFRMPFNNEAYRRSIY